MTTPEMRPEDVPLEIADAFYRTIPLATLGYSYADAIERIRVKLAAVYPLITATIEQQVRAKVAEELREDADAHRRLVARKPGEHDEARLARAKTLDDAAARITRGARP